MENNTLSPQQLAAECALAQEFAERLHALLCAIREKSVTQFAYNVRENVPRGIMTLAECAEQAVRMGLVSALGQYVDWSLSDGLHLAAEIADDVNAHDEASVIRGMATEHET